MKRYFKFIFLTVVIFTLVLPVAQSEDDWILPALWNWAIGTASPALRELVSQTSTQQEIIDNQQDTIDLLRLEIRSIENSIADLEDSVNLKQGKQTLGEFVGFSSSTVDVQAGFLGMDNACKIKFGTDARQATSEEIIESTVLPSEEGWGYVRAVMQPGGSDISGTLIIGDWLGPGSFSCYGWSSDTSSYGFKALIVNGDNYLFTADACQSPVSRKVACAKDSNLVKRDFNYVGFSSAEVMAQVGFKGMNSACQADFGPNARQATSKEILESTVKVSQIGNAYVRPAIQPSGADISGVTAVGFTNNIAGGDVRSGSLSCNGWSTSSASSFYKGLAVTGVSYQFGAYGCQHPVPLKVACSVAD